MTTQLRGFNPTAVRNREALRFSSPANVQGEEDFQHEEEETDEDIGVQAVPFKNAPSRRPQELRYPSEERMR